MRGLRDRIGRWSACIAVLLVAMLAAGAARAQTPEIRTSKDLYAPGEPIEIVFDGMPGEQRDWAAYATCDQADRHTRGFAYLRGARSGRIQLRAAAPGEYEARAYRAGGYDVLARHPFVVAERMPEATLRSSKDVYGPGEPVELAFEGMPGHGKDRIEIVRQGGDAPAARPPLLRGAASGRASFRRLEPGAYEARLSQEGGCRVLARDTFTVAEAVQVAEADEGPEGPGAREPASAARDSGAAPPAPTLALASDRVVAGEEIVVRFAGVPGHKRDWISIAEPELPPRQHRRWTWLRGATEGEHRFRGLPAGTYELRLFENGGYDVVVATPFRIEPAPEELATRERSRARADTPERLRARLGSRGREPAALTPEPTTRGPLTGTWEGELACEWAPGPAAVRVALIHYGDTTLRAVVGFEATDVDGNETRARYHAYGTTRETRHGRGGVWETSYGIELDPSAWIEQPDSMRFGSKVRASQSGPGEPELSASMRGFPGCSHHAVLLRTSSAEPSLAEPPIEVAQALDRLRYPAKRGDRKWSVPAEELFAEFAGGPFGEAADNASRCAVLGGWLEQVTAEYPEPDRIDQAVDDARRTQGRKLFTDPTFVPVFGRPIDEVSEPARRFVTEGSLGYCGLAAASIDQWLRVFLRQAFHLVDEEVAAADATARAHREALVWREEMIGELEALPTGAAAYATMLDLAERATTALDPLWPSERAPFEQALERTHRRLAEVALLAQLEEVLRGSEGLAGAQTLAGFRATNAALFERVSEPVGEEATGRIEARLDAVLEIALAAELERIAMRGEGLEAIAAGNAWYESFMTRHADFLARAPVVAARDAFLSMRADDLARGQAELLAAAALAESIGETLDLQATVLAVPGDWQTPTGEALRTALIDRRAVLYAELERSNARFWALSEHSPYEESLMDAAGRIGVPASYPEPRPHEILLAVVRSVASYSGERIAGNTVRYRLPSLKRAILSSPHINPLALQHMPDINLPVFARIEFQTARKLECRPGEAQGYRCRYQLASYVDSGLFASGGARVVEDHFVLGPSGWTTTTLGRRLGGASLESWRILADGVVRGLNSAACLHALPGDPNCY